MKVKKREGNVVAFDFNKIINVINKVLKENNLNTESITKYNIGLLEKAFTELNADLICIEDIQNIIEHFLNYIYGYDVAKSYSLYREKHRVIREMADSKKKFLQAYIKSNNTANATIDDNSNVTIKSIAVANSELHKEENKAINLKLWSDQLRSLYPDFDYKQMSEDFTTIMYPHDLSSQVGMPYCVSITLYPFLNDGLKGLGGLSASPKNIDSFLGMYINLIYNVAGQFKGAVATPGFLLCMDYFLRKEWGNDYYTRLNDPVRLGTSPRSIIQQIDQYFQQIVYTINQPSGTRGNQACFTNWSIFDKGFFEGMYSHFYFPDDTQPYWDSFNFLQKHFLHWFNKERLKCILTFPVVSVAMIAKQAEFEDKDMFDTVCSEYAEGNSFFTYISESADSLSSCCRLQNKLNDNTFNFTNGQIGEMTGSINVITLNLNRIVQDAYNAGYLPSVGYSWDAQKFKDYLYPILERVYKYQTAYKALLKGLIDSDMLPVYTSKFINIDRQYMTTGINGLNQAAEFLGIKCHDTTPYSEFVSSIFKMIKDFNISKKSKAYMANTEQTPCESAAIKLYDRDVKDGYVVPKDVNLYGSYVYKANDASINIFDKIKMMGNNYLGNYADGGAACHINLKEHLDKEQYAHILKTAANYGCRYITFNVPNCQCDKCGHIAKKPFEVCPKCGSKDVTLWDRIIGYLSPIKAWSSGRQTEQKTRVYD